MRKREKKREKREIKREKMSRVNHYQSAFNSQKEKLNILAEMFEISKSGGPETVFGKMCSHTLGMNVRMGLLVHICKCLSIAHFEYR